MTMDLEKQGAKPSGMLGKVIGRMMNVSHTPLYKRYFKDNLPPEHSKILDIGCGGGKFIQFLSRKDSSYKIYGLDHSPEMAEMSEKLNRKAIREKRVEIFPSSIEKLPLDSDSIDLATAFETIQFWPDIEDSFRRVNRVLKPGGTFLIINFYPQKGSRWWRIAQLKSEKDYLKALESAGFTDIHTDLDFKKGWIIVEAKK